MANRRIIVGISGASGFQYGFKALNLLHKLPEIETHLVMSKGADLTRQYETDIALDEVLALADVVHQTDNVAASIASGSFKTIGMLIAPCSMRTLAAIAHGFSDNLLARAADVVLKERRKLVLMVRETPLHLTHLENMQKITQMGGVIFPPVPALYHQPKSVDELITHSVSRALDQFDLTLDIPRWQGR